ncbi:MAG TPA: hypothetical protein VGB22_01535 [candidate division Zixibacteria bacterium]|jgi:Zn-dependent M16 (insulinase) family peptidase
MTQRMLTVAIQGLKGQRRTMMGVALMALTLTAFTPPEARSDNTLAGLTADQQIADFRVENLYDSPNGQAMGARFRHVPSGFVIDFLRIQSLPQAFIWVNSPPPSDQGEPHTCEHLLLGKGTKGRYVASLEDMALGQSSAFTMQLETCYHYNTSAGTDVFFELLEAKLDAMISPTFSDEEIRREVRNFGVTLNPDDSSLMVEEKGTVYNEMVSTYERPWSPLFREMGLLQYGKGHPMSLESGGAPEAIRTMTPDDLRAFHSATHHLNNMGMIMAVADDIGVEGALTTISGILQRVEPDAVPGQDPADAHFRVPAARPDLAGDVRIVSFPHRNAQEPGNLMFGWAPQLNLNTHDLILFELFLDNLAGGETSNLYRRFIDSQTRTMDIGASEVFGWVSDDAGYPCYVGFENVRSELLTDEKIQGIRGAILEEISTIAAWTNGSPDLARFNERIKSRIIESRRSDRKFLDTPPGFGSRGTGARWLGYLRRVQDADGFRKPLLAAGHYDSIETLVSGGANVWRDLIAQWNLLASVPFAVGARPDPEMVSRSEEERIGRNRAFVESLKTRYTVDDGHTAIRRYQDEYNAQTAIIDTEAATIAMPGFVNNPPLTLDDQLHCDVQSLPGGGPLVASRFDNMTAATVGLAFGLNVIPEDQLLYVVALPTLLTDVGVIRDGQPIAYDVMKESIRREISELRAYHSVNHRTRRAELVLRASGSELNEAQTALGWLSSALFDADWRVENLPRIRDAVDLELADARNTMRGSEESWVHDPQEAYWRQNDPLLLSADCFLTQTHALHRLRWRLKTADDEADRNAFSAFMSRLASLSGQQGRDALAATAAKLAGDDNDAILMGTAQTLLEDAEALSHPTRALVREAARDLQRYVPDFPDGSLAADWAYLCRQMALDLNVAPSKTLDELRSAMDRLRARDNVRSFVIASTQTQGALRPLIDGVVNRLGTQPSQRQSYGSRQHIVDRLHDHTPDIARPVFVGLVNENTRSGVHINTAPCASFTEHDQESLLRFLSARLYGGGGAHSMFMKTWGAGLAYSNGLRSNEEAGRLIYYAERCPDLTQTMQFVVNELKNAPYDKSLAEYAIAQAFAMYRGGARYETRGEEMADDLADGVTPDAVRSFRQGVMALRDSRNLFEELNNRMPYVYGQVLPGYGPTEADLPGAFYFVIGPEKQLATYEEYLRSVEGTDIRLARLYPRDYWLIDPDAVAVN